MSKAVEAALTEIVGLGKHNGAKQICKVGVILGELSPAKKQAVEIALGDTAKYERTAIVTYLKDQGKKVSYQTVGTHAAQRCACYRETSNGEG